MASEDKGNVARVTNDLVESKRWTSYVQWFDSSNHHGVFGEEFGLSDCLMRVKLR